MCVLYHTCESLHSLMQYAHIYYTHVICIAPYVHITYMEVANWHAKPAVKFLKVIANIFVVEPNRNKRLPAECEHSGG